MLRFLPGFYLDDMVYVKEGETKPVPGTDRGYYIKNNDFIYEEYDQNLNLIQTLNQLTQV